MIAVVLLREVDDEHAERDPGLLFTPEDVLAVAQELHYVAEYHAAPVAQRDRADWPVKAWVELPAGRRWAYWHRAAEAVQKAEAQRQAARG